MAKIILGYKEKIAEMKSNGIKVDHLTTEMCNVIEELKQELEIEYERFKNLTELLIPEYDRTPDSLKDWRTRVKELLIIENNHRIFLEDSQNDEKE